VVSQEVSSTTTDALVWSTRNGDRPSQGILWVYPERRFDRFGTETATFGRTPDCSFELPDSQVSRLHAAVNARSNSFELCDCGSRNGTYVNGVRTPRHQLREQDVVRIGGWVGVYLTPLSDDPPLAEISDGVFVGPRALATYKQAMRASQSPLPVVISGETGSGKEVLATTIHQLSGRTGHFVAVNCAALPESLAEGELFGYRKGAFTGANKSHLGYFRSADQGTLLLDEIADLSPGTQAKLLRVLEERAVVPLGESHPTAVNVRVLAAGQGRLCDAVVAGRFRADLFSRLRGMELQLPPLRERREEVVAIFTAQLRKNLSRLPEMTPEFIEALCCYSWPLNVREVVQLALQQGVLYGDREPWTARQLPETFREAPVVLGVPAPENLRPAPEARASVPTPGSNTPPDFAQPSPSEPPPLDRRAHSAVQRDEHLQTLLDALQQHGGNVSKAAAALGISRQRAYRLLEQRPELNLSELRYPR
jgi:transcriptional regulator with PAS, ATPase and Fis domain